MRRALPLFLRHARGKGASAPALPDSFAYDFATDKDKAVNSIAFLTHKNRTPSGLSQARGTNRTGEDW